MRINGEWQPSIDNPDVIHPIVAGRIVVSSEQYVAPFLVDTGADRTVIGSAYRQILRPYQQNTAESFLSAGGELDSFTATVQLVLLDASGRDVAFNLLCVVLTEPIQANNNLLGRDILDYFAVICDRSADEVILLRPPHKYHISG